MSESYWILEYIKVMLSYAAVFYLWPSVVFHRHLRGKGRSYRFAFCTLVPMVLFTTVISFLGVFRLLNVYLMGLLFYGPFLVQLLRIYNPFPKIGRQLHRIHNKTMTWKRLSLRLCLGIRNNLIRLLRWLKERTVGNRLRYAMLLIALLYGTVYFGYTALQFHSYGASDQYVHHAWIYALTQGIIYPKGVYPEGMHCIVYVMSCLLGVKIYSVNLFLAGIHIHAVLLGMYLMMRELFRWKFTPVLALYALLTVKQCCVDSIAGMSRLSWTLPQEIAFPALFLCAYSLLRYLKRESPNEVKVTWKALLRDEDLLLFSLAVCATIVVHFYATVMAVFLCGVIFVFYFFRRIQWKKLLGLVLSALLALLLAVAPMMTALAAGYKFQGSIHWAIAVTKGGEADWAEGKYGIKEPDDTAVEAPAPAAPEEVEPLSLRVSKKLEDLYKGTWQEIYPGERGAFFLALTLGTIVISSVGTVCAALIRRRKRKTGRPVSGVGPFLGYLVIACTLLVLVTEYWPALVGLPILISGSRLCVLIELSAMMLCCCLPDLLFSSLEGRAPMPLLNGVSAVACAAVYILCLLTGNLHGYLYNEMTRYPAAVNLAERILLYVPEQSYTIVSTTDEYYQILGHGFHEELLDFTDNRKNRNYTLPTPYIFVFMEKNPLHYAHILFSSGPSWLASEGYPAVLQRYRDDVRVYPDILHGETSLERTEEKLQNMVKRSDAAAILSNREILESRALQWLDIFSAAHPQDGSLVYEDENFLCYCIHQNPKSLFSLGIVD